MHSKSFKLKNDPWRKLWFSEKLMKTVVQPTPGRKSPLMTTVWGSSRLFAPPLPSLSLKLKNLFWQPDKKSGTHCSIDSWRGTKVPQHRAPAVMYITGRDIKHRWRGVNIQWWVVNYMLPNGRTIFSNLMAPYGCCRRGIFNDLQICTLALRSAALRECQQGLWCFLRERNCESGGRGEGGGGEVVILPVWAGDKEYWTVYRGPVFLPVEWFGSTHSPSPSCR